MIFDSYSRFNRVFTLASLFVWSTLSVKAADQTSVFGLRDNIDFLISDSSIPTIVAHNEYDLAFAQGYLHAKDRFFQMDYNRRLISGTLAELVGASALPMDIQLRTLGLRRGARQTYAAMSMDSRARLRAYAHGVNFWLMNNPLPPEYTRLELSRAKQWSPIDALAIIKALAFQLSEDLEEVDRTVTLGAYQGAGQTQGFDGTALFFDDTHRAAPPDDRVTVPGFLESIGGVGEGTKKSLKTPFSEFSNPQLEVAGSLLKKFRDNPYFNKLLNASADEVGSNWWIVSGDRTDSGHPIVANDPHLNFGLPAIFYPQHIVAQNDADILLNAAGVGVPGAPGIIQGCTSTLCWGSSVNPIDEMDFFFEKVKVNQWGLPTHTTYKGREEPLLWIFQQYFANNIGDGIIDNVKWQNVPLNAGRITFIVPRRNHGPIVNIEGGTAVSVQYTGLGATFELEAFHEMNHAKDIFDFQKATTKFDFGSQNYGVADSFGNIGYFTSAELPIREDLQTLGISDGGIPPMFIRDGTGVLMHEWMSVQHPQPNQATPSEILTLEETPHVINPASGYIVNSNNDPVGTSLDNNPLNQMRPNGGLYYLNRGGYSSYRAGRADRLLHATVATGPVSANQMKEMQQNNQMLDAELMMPHILMAFTNASEKGAWTDLAAMAGDSALQAVKELFEEWDFSTPTGIAEGYDPGDDASELRPPGKKEIADSVATTIYSVWRGKMIKNTLDATLTEVGLEDHLPGDKLAFNAMKHHLDNFERNQGVGASGINFFPNLDAPTPEDARDFLILTTIRQALDALAGDEYAEAFNGSVNLMDYRWGKLHRVVFNHPLGGAFSLPNGQYDFSTVEGLKGIPRAGGYQVVDAANHSARADGLDDFMASSGPARRFVGQLLPAGIRAEQVIPGGQSGVIGGPEYANQLYSWLVNSYLPLFLDAEQADHIATERYGFTAVHQ